METEVELPTAGSTVGCDGPRGWDAARASGQVLRGHHAELLPSAGGARGGEGLEATETSSMLWAHLAFDWRVERFPSFSWSFDETLLFLQDWQPPFACDVDKLHFTPRIQRLNELEVNCKAEHRFCSRMFKYSFERQCFPVD